jgi:hypothetical protein
VNVIHVAEGLHHGGVLLDDVTQPVVGDRDERVYLGLEFLGGALGDELAAGALEGERLGDDADSECAEVLGDLGHDWGGAGTGASPEAGGDEDHVRVAESVSYLLGVFLGCALADGGVSARAETTSDLVAYADLVRRVRLEEGLRVRVAGDELDPHHLGANHPVDGVATTATHTDDTD